MRDLFLEDLSNLAVMLSSVTLIICLAGGTIKNCFENTKNINAWKSGLLFYWGTYIFHIIASLLLTLTFWGGDTWLESTTLIGIIAITTLAILIDIKYGKAEISKNYIVFSEIKVKKLIIVWLVLSGGMTYAEYIMCDKGIIASHNDWVRWVVSIIIVFIVTKIISFTRMKK